MRNYRFISIVAIMLTLVTGMAASVIYAQNHREEIHDSYTTALTKAPHEEKPLEYISENYNVKEGFCSHLPIVVMDTNGVEPPVNTYFDNTHTYAGIGIYVPKEDVEPYVDGEILLYNSEEGINSLADQPVTKSLMRIKRRGNTSMTFEKAQWLVKLVTESGQDREVDILGMGAEHEWILNGSMYDKSMLRNYLAYSVISRIMKYTPDSRFCEVLIKNGTTYSYQGVYLICENIKQGTNRVDIAEYKESNTFNSYLLRKDRYDVEALTLENYGRIQGFNSEYLALLYPSKYRVTTDMTEYVNRDISYIEKILYSENPKIFGSYKDVLDVDSFVDYFLVNEFLGNYDAGNNSTYFYKDLGGRLSMGPVWDFDGAMDNYIYEPLDTESLAFYTKPWFDCLCKDLNFVKKLEKRYTKLRQGPLSNDYVIGKIDEITAYLGGAIEREWMRWGHWYTTDNVYSLEDYTGSDGITLKRNAVTYEDEIYRIKTVLREHADSISTGLKMLEKNAELTTGLSKWMGWLLLLAAVVFLIPAIFVSYKK
ncbi:CotH kinase family protein [Blautia schinkii]|nr:CotH kinase family protein [Blautia schinkii]